MKLNIVVDTNIVFSAILNPSSKIAKIIIGSKNHFHFYTCDFLKIELQKHQKKLIKLTNLSIQELDELNFLLTKNITFINEGLLPQKVILDTAKVLAKVDLNDIPFVALTKYLEAKLWTGDKELITGLNGLNFIETATTGQLSDLLNKLEQ